MEISKKYNNVNDNNRIGVILRPDGHIFGIHSYDNNNNNNQKFSKFINRIRIICAQTSQILLCQNIIRLSDQHHSSSR